MGRQILKVSHDEMMRCVSLEMASPSKDDIYERRTKVLSSLFEEVPIDNIA